MLNQNKASETLPDGVPGHESAAAIFLDATGTRHRLSDFRGSPVVLVFHTPEWDPARVELVEAYNRIVAHIPHGGGRLVSIAPDAPWHALAFAGDDTVSVPIIVSDSPDLRNLFGVDTRPAVVLLDGDGNVRWRHSATHALPRPDVVASALEALTSLNAATRERKIVYMDETRVCRNGSRRWRRVDASTARADRDGKHGDAHG